MNSVPVSRSSAYVVHAAPPPCSADPGVFQVSAPGLVPVGNEIEAPRQRTVGDVERHHPALDAPVAAGLATYTRSFHTIGAAPTPSPMLQSATCRTQSGVAGLGIERVEKAVLRAADDAAAGDRDALVGRVHLRALRDVLMRPELLARRRVDRVGAQMRGRVEDAVVDHRSGRERAELAELEHAHRAKIRRVRRC